MNVSLRRLKESTVLFCKKIKFYVIDSGRGDDISFIYSGNEDSFAIQMSSHSPLCEQRRNLKRSGLVSIEKRVCNPHNVLKGICDIIWAVRLGCVSIFGQFGSR